MAYRDQSAQEPHHRPKAKPLMALFPHWSKSLPIIGLYANSVLQCLYFSPPFRQHVLNFPNRLSSTASNDTLVGKPNLELDTSIAASPSSAPSDSSKDHVANGAPVPPVQTLRLSTITATHPIVTAAESRDTFDNRKKAIMAVGPHVRMQTAKYTGYSMPESLFTSLKDMFEAIIAHQSRMGVVVPTRLIEVLRENFANFRLNVHHDAHEFLNLLLNEIVEQVDAYTKQNPTLISAVQADTAPAGKPLALPTAKASWVHDLFEGVLTNETRCLTCENVSQRDEIFLDLSVDLEEHSSITSCLTRFSEEEMLSERNKFQCEKCCSLQEAEKRMKIKKLPKILALHLKRFKWFDGGLRKLFDRVVFPFYLRIQNTTEDAEDPDRLYELYAVIVHLGSNPNHGHYVSIIKTPERGWLLFDDELVLPVDANYVRRYFGGDPRSSACAYVLFYQETTEDAIVREQDVEDPFSRDVVLGTQRDDSALPITPAEETPPVLDSIQTTLKTPTTEISIPRQIPNAEDQDFLTHISNPTVTSPRPQSGHLGRLSSEAPTAAGADPPERANERASMDKLNSAPASSATEDSRNEQSPGKLPDKTGSKHRSMFGGNSKSMTMRLRNSSLSLKGKPRLFSRQERSDANKESNESAVTDAGASEDAAARDVPTKPQVDGNESQPKFMKHKASRFALGRKKSGSNLL
ncbi:MAG: hypothetical protein Q9162_006977 [Coniocarpon cinnabarinum]